MITGFSHIQLVVADVAASAEWFAEVLGLEPFASGVTASGPYAALRHGGSGAVIGMQTAAPDQTLSASAVDHLSFGISDSDELRGHCERLRARGYPIGEIFEEAVSLNARLRSPDGLVVELTAPKPRG